MEIRSFPVEVPLDQAHIDTIDYVLEFVFCCGLVLTGEVILLLFGNISVGNGSYAQNGFCLIDDFNSKSVLVWFQRWIIGVASVSLADDDLYEKRTSGFTEFTLIWGYISSNTKVYSTYHPAKIIVSTFATLDKEIYITIL